MEYLTNLYFNQPIIILDTSASVGLTSGALVSYGGASISGDTYIGGKTVLQGGLTASSLNVTGNLFVGGPIMKIPTGDIASRPVNATEGNIRYNTETQQFEGYGPGGAWGSLGGVIDIAQTTKILASGSPSTTDGNLYFYTVNSERMRINSAGNIGIGTSAPSYLLDVNGTGAFINVTASGLYSTNLTSTNIVATNLTAGTLGLNAAVISNATIANLMNTNISSSQGVISNLVTTNQTNSNILNTNITSTNAVLANVLNTNISSSNAIITNIVSTNETNSNLLNTNFTSTNAFVSHLLNTNVSSTNAIITNIVSTNETNSNLLNTNFTSTNAVVSHLVNTNMTGTNILASNITAGTINASFGNYATVTSSLVASTTISAGSVYLSGDINVAGTLTVVNITATNILNTNVSAGVVLANTTFAGVGNSNTLGSLYTTGGNVGIGSTSPTATLDVNGTAVFSTSVSSASIFGGNSTITNLVATNLTAGTLGLSDAVITNATISNLFNTNITSSQGVITSLLTTNQTNSNLLNTNITSTNVIVSNALITNETTSNLVNTSFTSGGGVITNVVSTNQTNSNLLNTNITSTNGVITNVVSTNETNSNLLNTNITSTNAVVSNVLNTNITSTNAVISNILNTNMTSTNAIITNISSTNETNSNLLNTNITSTNAVISNVLNTNITSTNAIITNGVFTNSSVGKIHITATDNSISVNDGGVLIVAGGARIAKNLFVGGPAFQIPQGDTASRPVSAQQGYIRYNSEYSQFEGFGAGDAWGSLGGVSDIAQTTKILASSSPGVTDGNLYFFNVGNENMRLNSAGNLGLGTTAPGYKLDVVGTFSASVGATLGSLNVTGGTIINTVDVTPNLGDISKERSFSLANGSSGVITGFAFNGSIVRGFQALATVQIICSDGQDLYANFDLRGIQLKNSTWVMTSVFLGDQTGVDFTMNTSGQVLYTSTSIGNYTSSNVKFRALTTNV